MPSNVVPAIPASQLVNVIPSVLEAAANPLQFWGLIVDSTLDANGYPLIPIGDVLLFSDTTDVGSYFGIISQEAGLASVYFIGPVNSTRAASGLLMTQYALGAVPAYLRGGTTSGLPLGSLQAIDGTLSVTIDGAPVTATVNLATALSFSQAAEMIGSALGVHGVPKGTFQAALNSVGNIMTVAAFTPPTANGPHQATVTANLLGTTMTVTGITGGALAVGQVLVGTGITAGTTITAWEGGGQPGIGSYSLSASATTETGVTISAYALAPTILIGDVVTGTGIPSNIYITGQTSGTIGGAGVYTLSGTVSTESAETIEQFAPGCTYNPLSGSFHINSGTTGPGSSVSFGSGAAAVPLALTVGTGAIQSPGVVASSPTSFMDAITVQTQDWVSFMTTWEPTDEDKASDSTSSFASWTSAQDNGYRYCMWETNIVDTTFGGPSAAVAAINNANYTGTVMIWTNPAITILAGEKAAFSMGWAAALDFSRLNGRQTEAFKSYVGGVADVTNGTVAETLAGVPQTGTFGFGMNFYGQYTTRSQGFPQFQRGLISGPFTWDDTYTNQIWLNASLQGAIMVGLTNATFVPYANPGYATIESWCLDPILAALNFGAIVSGVELSQAQTQEVNESAGIEIAPTLQQRGWYLQLTPASAATRAIRASPPCTLWYTDGGAVQALTLASIVVQ